MLTTDLSLGPRATGWRGVPCDRLSVVQVACGLLASTRRVQISGNVLTRRRVIKERTQDA